jgi:hypothetical protein
MTGKKVAPPMPLQRVSMAAAIRAADVIRAYKQLDPIR